MNVLGVQMQDKTALIIGGAVLVIGYWAIKTAANTTGKALNWLGDKGFNNPLDAIAANFGILPDNKSGATLTPDFQDYINQNGGMAAYIKAHKNGTFTGSPYFAGTNSNGEVLNSAAPDSGSWLWNALFPNQAAGTSSVKLPTSGGGNNGGATGSW